MERILDWGRTPLGALHLLASVLAATATPGRAQSSDDLIRPGDVVAANIADHTVSVFDGRSGEFRGRLATPSSGVELVNPTGIAFGSKGDLYVASSGNARILRFDGASGKALGVAIQLPHGERPFSILVAPDGDLYVSSGPAVLRYDAEGQPRGDAARDSSLAQPIGVALGRDGLLYVASSTTGSILRFDPVSGRLVDMFASDSLSFPSDVVFGPHGDLYVSAAGKRRVVRFDGSSGAFVDVVATLPDGVPMGLAVSVDGKLLIGDFGSSRLFRLEDGAEPGTHALRLLASEGLARPENIAVKPAPGAERPSIPEHAPASVATVSHRQESKSCKESLHRQGHARVQRCGTARRHPRGQRGD